LIIISLLYWLFCWEQLVPVWFFCTFTIVQCRFDPGSWWCRLLALPSYSECIEDCRLLGIHLCCYAVGTRWKYLASLWSL